MGAFLDFRLKWQHQGRTGEVKRGEESLFHRAFLNLRHEMVNWATAFEVIAEDVLTPLVEGAFSAEKASGGIPWADLAPSTIAARGSEHPILEVTGKLKASFVSKSHADHIENITPHKLQWGSNLPHALYHQTGTGAGFQRSSPFTGPLGRGVSRGMPMRKIIELTEKAKTRMSRTMTGRIAQVARQLGFKISGHEKISPGEARRIGQIALGLRS